MTSEELQLIANAILSAGQAIKTGLIEVAQSCKEVADQARRNNDLMEKEIGLHMIEDEFDDEDYDFPADLDN